MAYARRVLSAGERRGAGGGGGGFYICQIQSHVSNTLSETGYGVYACED